MKEIVFLLEEPSARAMIEGIVPRIEAEPPPVRYIVFEGKQDLERQLIRKLRAYRNPDAVFIVMRDQDFADCRDVKENLKRKCADAGRPGAVVRVACRALESWYLADLAAVEAAFGTRGLAQRQNDRKFRTPDGLGNPDRELKRLVPEYQKIGGSRRIAPHLDLDNERSRSFYHLVKTIKDSLSTNNEYYLPVEIEL
ncbi:MAG TPA: DUF4276 family protein [Spirochaetota bacterium]|nr:DUF4276 family protein [Spirochaetota bacterium]HNU91339.1 DUF4276 family protein [Spirochaetota bacterium]HPV98960.1 DUF4276 family protein [Spirochaetota bacterium]